jgi:hypothetical protein
MSCLPAPSLLGKKRYETLQNPDFPSALLFKKMRVIR